MMALTASCKLSPDGIVLKVTAIFTVQQVQDVVDALNGRAVRRPRFCRRDQGIDL
jgi:hypothetical protein